MTSLSYGNKWIAAKNQEITASGILSMMRLRRRSRKAPKKKRSETAFDLSGLSKALKSAPLKRNGFVAFEILKISQDLTRAVLFFDKMTYLMHYALIVYKLEIF